MITAANLVKAFGSGEAIVRALDDVSLHVREGEVFGVVGRSGAGKSTLIRAINVLSRPDSGSVRVAGQEITELTGARLRAARHSMGMIFQHFNLLANRTVLANVELPLEITGVGAAERRTRALECLDFVGLADKARSYPAQLSGGQKQRVGIARALAGRPRVLLSDEATSALDPETTRSILDLVRRLNRELGLTVLLITHEMDVVKTICDSAALMENGRIVEQGPLVQRIAADGSRLARELFPLGEPPTPPDQVVLDITFSGGTADSPVIARIARVHQLDVSILGATIETIAGSQAGRTRLGVPGDLGQVNAVIADLRRQGLHVEVVADRGWGGGLT